MTLMTLNQDINIDDKIKAYNKEKKGRNKYTETEGNDEGS